MNCPNGQIKELRSLNLSKGKNIKHLRYMKKIAGFTGIISNITVTRNLHFLFVKFLSHLKITNMTLNRSLFILNEQFVSKIFFESFLASLSTR